MTESASTSIWSGFHKKALRERQNQLRLVYPNLFPASNTKPSPESPESSLPNLQPTTILSQASRIQNASTASLAGLGVDLGDEPFPVAGLDETVADNMIENCIGTIGLPVGLALNFVINGIPLIIPMAVEEPSVVAAVSGAAKTISAACKTGFTATTSARNIVYAQVLLLNVTTSSYAVDKILAQKDDLINAANAFVPNMVKRGGGVLDVSVKILPRDIRHRAVPQKPRQVSLVESIDSNHDSKNWLVVMLHLDVCDAMGANSAATVAEGIAPVLVTLLGESVRAGLRIVSNLCVERLAKASFRIPLSKMAYKSFSGRQVASRMIEAVEWAQNDPYRATTHNKGIMNGIDAVAIATGQDWRAIEAASHAWAAGCGREDESESKPIYYRPLTNYWVESNLDSDLVNDRRVSRESEDDLYFCGELELPISVGTQGGVLKTNPVYNYMLGIMEYPDSKKLAMAMVSIGLAQNFAALRALSTEGIQKGHMNLHARNIAIAAGAPAHAISECVAYMIESSRINQTVAKEYLVAHEIHNTLKCGQPNQSTSKPPSTFYIEAPYVPNEFHLSDGQLTLNIAFETLSEKPVHLLMNTSIPATPLLKNIFSARFDYSWITSTMAILDKIELTTIAPSRSNRLLVKKLKLLSILMNILTRSMMIQWPNETRRLVDRVLKLAIDGGRADASSLRRSRLDSSISNHTSTSLKSCNANAMKTETLKVGRPLLLALWQVFELRVLQWIGHEPLCNMLLETQLEILKSLSDAGVPFSEFNEDNNSLAGNTQGICVDSSKFQAIDKLHAIIRNHSRRFQTSQFLLCDASSHDSNLLTVPRLRLLKSIGNLLAWEQMCAHDISVGKLARDLAVFVFNSAFDFSGMSGYLDIELVESGGHHTNGLVFWITEDMGSSGLKTFLADLIDNVTISVWIKGDTTVSPPQLKDLREAILKLDLHTVFSRQICEFIKVSSQQPVLMRMLQEEEDLEIFNKETLIGITRLYRSYYDVGHFY